MARACTLHVSCALLTRSPRSDRSLARTASLLGGIRYCNYTGLYYCPRCHHNEKTLIPARIVHNWDTKEHKVHRTLGLCTSARLCVSLTHLLVVWCRCLRWFVR
jgi:hypothetical protein